MQKSDLSLPACTLVPRCLKSELFIFAKNVNAARIPLFPNCCVELPPLLFLRGAVGGEATKEAGLQTPVVLQAVNASLFTAGMELTLIPAARGHNKLDAASAKLHHKNAAPPHTPPPTIRAYCYHNSLQHGGKKTVTPATRFFGFPWRTNRFCGSGGWRKRELQS